MITPSDLIIATGLAAAAGWLAKCVALHIHAHRRQSQHRRAIAEWRRLGRHRG